MSAPQADVKHSPAEAQSTLPTSSRELIRAPRQSQRRTWLRNTAVFVSIAALAGAVTKYLPFSSVWGGASYIDPLDYVSRANRILSTTPLIDGHNDLPYLIRIELKNKIYDRKKFPFSTGLLSHTDERKIREGKLGGQFWSVFVECAEDPATGIDDPTVRKYYVNFLILFGLLKKNAVGSQRYFGADRCDQKTSRRVSPSASIL